MNGYENGNDGSGDNNDESEEVKALKIAHAQQIGALLKRYFPAHALDQARGRKSAGLIHHLKTSGQSFAQIGEQLGVTAESAENAYHDENHRRNPANEKSMASQGDTGLDADLVAAIRQMEAEGTLAGLNL